MDWRQVDGFFSEQDASDYRALYSQLPNGAAAVEVGCFRGKSLASVSDIIIENDLMVLAVDPFDLVDNPTYIEPGVEIKKAGMYEDFISTLDLCGIQNQVVVRDGLSVDIASRLQEKYDLVFLDGDHSYEAVKADIQAWGPLIEEGGILCGHDWDEHGVSWPGVHKAVVELLGWPSFRKHIWAFRKVNGEFKAETEW